MQGATPTVASLMVEGRSLRMPPVGPPAKPGYRRGSGRPGAGQSLAEFALIVPVILLLLIGIADLGRVYAAAVAIEAAAREAADYGAFDREYWTSTNVPVTVAQMRLRACTAAAGSQLSDYETTDPINNSTCSNPTFTCTLEHNGASADCEASGGFTNGIDCSDPLTDPPCTVHVRIDYQYRLILGIPPLPGTVQLRRDSYFRISALTPPP